MSHEPPSFEEVLWHLIHNDDAQLRVQAAQMLGEYVDNLDDEQYAQASGALNRALNDRDPMVIMASMTALSAYQRRARDIQTELTTQADVDEDTLPIADATCSVCGKPQALVDGTTCEQPQCPYR